MSDFLIVEEKDTVHESEKTLSKKKWSNKTFTENLNDIVLSLQKVKTKEKLFFIDFSPLWQMLEWVS